MLADLVSGLIAIKNMERPRSVLVYPDLIPAIAAAAGPVHTLAIEWHRNISMAIHGHQSAFSTYFHQLIVYHYIAGRHQG